MLKKILFLSLLLGFSSAVHTKQSSINKKTIKNLSLQNLKILEQEVKNLPIEEQVVLEKYLQEKKHGHSFFEVCSLVFWGLVVIGFIYTTNAKHKRIIEEFEESFFPSANPKPDQVV